MTRPRLEAAVVGPDPVAARLSDVAQRLKGNKRGGCRVDVGWM